MSIEKKLGYTGLAVVVGLGFFGSLYGLSQMDNTRFSNSYGVDDLVAIGDTNKNRENNQLGYCVMCEPSRFQYARKD